MISAGDRPPEGQVPSAWSSSWNAAKIALPIAHRGAIAQLGERIVRNDEVVGSIPTSSTKMISACA